MNYSKIYNSLIVRAQNRELTGYVEKHHIVPRCMNGTNNLDNIVPLTAKEHFLAHLLLCELYPDNDKLYFAAYAMCQQDRLGSRYKPSSRTYERLKKEASERKSRKVPFNCTYCGKHNDRLQSHMRPVANYCDRKCYRLAAQRGKALAKGNIHIHKGTEAKFIKSEDLYKYPDWEQGRVALTKKVARICPETNQVITVYDRVTDVTGDGFRPTGVSRCMNGFTKTHKGSYWKQIDNF